jgi:two-component system response regulator TtrR
LPSEVYIESVTTDAVATKESRVASKQENPCRTVVVVDQDAATCKAISRHAEPGKFCTVALNSHADFLEWLKRQASLPLTEACCLILDVQELALMEGQTLPEALRDIPKIYLGWPNFSFELGKLARMGLYSAIERPFSVSELNQAVLSALSHHEKILHGTRQTTERMDKLSRRELEVGLLVVQGLTNQGIGERLGISIKTVKAHRAKVMEKTGSNTLVDLVWCFDKFSRLNAAAPQ